MQWPHAIRQSLSDGDCFIAIAEGNLVNERSWLSKLGNPLEELG
jgi:hypothetical protein